MTDNEIIKVLERRANFNYKICSCNDENCEGDECEKVISENILDLINRLKAEIERLKSMNQSKLDIIHDVRTDLETAKSEAIREFAERLKNKSRLLAPSVYAEPFRAVSVEEIDNLVAEMTEGNNAE